MISDIELKRLFSYSPESGEFTWIYPQKGRRCGDIAGTIYRGYIRIQIMGVNYAAHRLAWLFMTGSYPDGEIDHINRIRSDNRWENLRVVSRSQNCANKHFDVGITGKRGVHFIKKTNKYAAVIGKDGKRIRIGTFFTADEASAAYEKEFSRLYG